MRIIVETEDGISPAEASDITDAIAQLRGVKSADVAVEEGGLTEEQIRASVLAVFDSRSATMRQAIESAF